MFCSHFEFGVKDGLDVIGDAIEKVRDVVAFWTCLLYTSDAADE